MPLTVFAPVLWLLLSMPLCFQAPSPSPEPIADAYALGPGDQIIIRVPDVEEIGNGAIPLDYSGYVDLPLVGRLKASGLTTEQLATTIRDRLRKYYMHPDVSVYVAEMRSQPVSVLGAVAQPGVRQVQGEKTLFEVLSLAGGLRPDAGNVVRITRRIKWGRIPLGSAMDDPTGQFSVASVDVKGIMAASSPEENILIKPDDVISVPTAEMIYAVGAFKKPGGYVMGSNRSLSALQILSLAEGFDHAAGTASARIMRHIPGSADHTEIPIDLKKMLEGKTPDVPLQANDILFVPTSTAKLAAFRTVEALVQAGTYSIYRLP